MSGVQGPRTSTDLSPACLGRCRWLLCRWLGSDAGAMLLPGGRAPHPAVGLPPSLSASITRHTLTPHPATFCRIVSNMLLQASVAAALVASSMAAQRPPTSDACLNCESSSCALLPPAGSSFPCYEGTLENANSCYNTDPLVDSASTFVCDTCASQGYTQYLQNDPIYKNMGLWTRSSKELGASARTEICTDCTDVCSILAPSGSSFPCYQGTPENANFCYNTDPLIDPASTYICNTCSTAGYTVYLQNDPVYRNMELWGKPTLKSTTGGKSTCSSCSQDLCSILPPDGSNFPCYQGSVSDTNFCFNTDPLLQPNSTTSCQTCADSGYGSYLQNDPIYKNMELWTQK